MSSFRKKRSWITPLILAPMVVALGCSQGPNDYSANEGGGQRSDIIAVSDNGDNQVYGFAAQDETETRTEVRTRTTTTDRNANNEARRGGDRSMAPGSVSQSLYFPGTDSANIIRLEKIGPSEIRAGQAYEYQIRVTNTSDMV